MTGYERVPVDVLVAHTREKGKLPRVIWFRDGEKYTIDAVRDRRQAAATKAGGTGIRYTIRIGARETYLFEDGETWFVEARVEGGNAYAGIQ